MRHLICAGIVAAALGGCSGADETGSGGATGSGAGGTGGTAGSGGGTCEVDSSYDPPIVPANFKAAVNNRLYPLIPGTVFTYQNGDEHIEVTVLAETKEILGVTCTVVHDQATVNGEVTEDTMDWFAQDQDGAVWYFGEDTAEYENGEVVSREGSWTAGVDGAKPGILIPANPVIGMEYRQEYYACHAEDMGAILDLDASAVVAFGSYDGCMETHDFTPLEPTVDEKKYYCPNVGLVLSEEGTEREELVDITAP